MLSRLRSAALPDRRSRGRTLLMDSLLALVLVAVGIPGTALAGEPLSDGVVAPGPFGYTIVVVAGAMVALRRIAPVTTLVVVTVANASYLAKGYPYGPILLSLLVAVYTLARYVPIRRAVILAAGSLVFMLAHIVLGRRLGGLLGIVPGSAWVVVPFAAGLAVGLHQEAVIRERRQQAQAHADAERQRVAQEVHDVVGHGLSAITMQAEIALHLLDRQPEQARSALSAISRTSREALDDLRVTLGLVRRSGGDDEDRAPLPGLARLDDLVARMSDSGVRVHVHTAGIRRTLPSAADLTAYRVVQESLTNVLRHAGAVTAEVRLDFQPDEVSIEVTDTGRGGASEARPGHGLAGMRERVTALGGTFHAGPGSAGGFQVHARLPTP